MWGRIVRAHDAGSPAVRSFYVGFDDDDVAVATVQRLQPELASWHWEGRERLSPTATAYMELLPSEVREPSSAWVFFRAIEPAENSQAWDFHEDRVPAERAFLTW